MEKKINTVRKSKTKILGIDKIQDELNSFKECISAFSKNLEIQSEACEELQELFFKFANSNDSLPENIDLDSVDSFIAILITVVNINYGFPAALEGLRLLLKYLKMDDKVFNRFNPNKDLLRQLNLDKYLSTEGEEGKDLVLDFICFVLRYYKDVEYHEISSNQTILNKIRKVEMERTWMDLEGLVLSQDQIQKVAQKNQELTSSAMAELFSHIEDIRRQVTISLTEFRRELHLTPRPIPPLPAKSEKHVDSAVLKNVEAIMNEKISELRRAQDAIIAQTADVVIRQDEMIKRMEELETSVESSESTNTEIIALLNSESKLAKENYKTLTLRLSKSENDILTLTKRNFSIAASPSSEVGGKEMSSLRIDSLRNQIDTDIAPKLSEALSKIHNMEVKLASRIFDNASNSQPEMVMKLNDRFLETLSGFIKNSVDLVSSETQKCKKLIEANKEQIAGLQATIKQNRQNDGDSIDQIHTDISLINDRLLGLLSDTEGFKKQVPHGFPPPVRLQFGYMKKYLQYN